MSRAPRALAMAATCPTAVVTHTTCRLAASQRVRRRRLRRLGRKGGCGRPALRRAGERPLGSRRRGVDPSATPKALSRSPLHRPWLCKARPVAGSASQAITGAAGSGLRSSARTSVSSTIMSGASFGLLGPAARSLDGELRADRRGGFRVVQTCHSRPASRRVPAVIGEGHGTAARARRRQKGAKSPRAKAPRSVLSSSGAERAASRIARASASIDRALCAARTRSRAFSSGVSPRTVTALPGKDSIVDQRSC